MATTKPSHSEQVLYRDATTLTIPADGVQVAYRDLGPRRGVPLIFFTHVSGNLDNWDPRIVDGIAANRRVITFDYRGVGASSGKVRPTIELMAGDAADFISALGLDQVDVLGFSLGGMVAQALVQSKPQLIRRLILAGTSPAGSPALGKLTRRSDINLARAVVTLRDPKELLFFPRTSEGKAAAKDFLRRLKERTTGRDKTISFPGYRTQLKAIQRWGQDADQELGTIQLPVLVVNGDNDQGVPTSDTIDLARRLPNSQLVLYPGSGHGAIFQYHREFVETVLAFLTGNG
ncbi:alpha/beta hydrolase [Arthrobacter sp. NPDC080073]|uniref:alpha/beta fold hydrolase n=1 Tax=Arthrobacter sp. NPDC080073 TaxID=3155919 RepID=UPI0034282A37